MRRLICWLLDHRWAVRQPISFIPFDQGGVECSRCFKSYGIHSVEAARIAEQHGL